MEICNFPKQLYVGRKVEHDGDVLGFAVPDGTDSAAQKRKETVDQWAGKHWNWALYHPNEPDKRLEALTLENKPLSGFRFDHSVSRYETSNKWFRINDPRGFQLEITAHNLSDLLNHNDFLKGEIQGEFLWGRIGAINHLISVNDERYLTFLAPPERKKLEVGDMVESPTVNGRYIGTFYVSSLTYRDVDKNDPLNKTQKFYYGYGATRNTHYFIEQNKQPYLVFVYLSKHDPNYRHYNFARKLSDKAIITASDEPMPEIPYGDRHYYFHATKEEQDAFTLTQQEINEIFHNEWKSKDQTYYGPDYYERHYKDVNYPLWPDKVETKYT